MALVKPMLAAKDVNGRRDGAPLHLAGDLPASLVGSGDSNSVDPVHVYVDYMPLPSEGARKFSNDASDGALGPWHSRHVKIAHVALLATSAYQFLIGAYICLGIGSSFPAVSSALSGTLGLVQAVRYLVVDSSNPANELKLTFVLAALATPFNLICLVYLIVGLVDFPAPLQLGMICIYLGQAGSFAWIALRAWRVKNSLSLSSVL